MNNNIFKKYLKIIYIILKWICYKRNIKGFQKFCSFLFFEYKINTNDLI